MLRLSSLSNTSARVPQGGDLSLLLFLIVTYELPEAVPRYRITCKRYADDLKIYKVTKGTTTLTVLSIGCAVNWADEWKLALAPEKSH